MAQARHSLRREQTPFDPYRSRVQFLQDEALAEGFVISEDSLRDFKELVGLVPGIRKCNLILMDNGNIRAIWKDDSMSQCGLHFLGRGMVRFVMVRRPKGQDLDSLDCGHDTVKGVLRRVDLLGLTPLLSQQQSCSSLRSTKKSSRGQKS